jgi:phospholipase/lecithinase/hemolysin
MKFAMHIRLRRLGALFCVATAAVFASVSAQASAEPYTSLTVFGDSLSDTGSLAGLLAGGPQGRFSDGLNWIDYLAEGLGLSEGTIPRSSGSNDSGNYAVGGALTGTGTVNFLFPNIRRQIDNLWAPSHPAADPNGLYVVVGGGNDMNSAGASGANTTEAQRQAAAQTAANNIFLAVSSLAARGAEHVLISTLPDLGITPQGAGKKETATDATLRYNELVWELEGLLEAAFDGLDVMVLDMYGIAMAAYEDPEEYGFNNIGTCNKGAAASCATSLFWDNLHPTQAAYALIGAAALELVTAVPLPGTAALAVLALLALVGLRRRVVASTPSVAGPAVWA